MTTNPLSLQRGNAPFQVTGDGAALALLDLHEVTAQDAADHGCPGATHLLTSRLGATYGTAVAVGASKRVPGWTRGTLGVHVRFTPAVLDPETGTDVVTGYVNGLYVN